VRTLLAEVSCRCPVLRIGKGESVNFEEGFHNTKEGEISSADWKILETDRLSRISKGRRFYFSGGHVICNDFS